MYPETSSLCDPFLRPPLCALILTVVLIITILMLTVLGVRFGSELVCEITWLISLLWVVAAFGLILSIYGLRKGCRHAKILANTVEQDFRDRLDIEEKKLIYNMHLFGNQSVKRRLHQMSQEYNQLNSSRDSEIPVFLECEHP